MCKFILSIFFLSGVYADNNLNMDAITSQQLLNTSQYNRESGLNNSMGYKVNKEESTPIQTGDILLNKNSSNLLNQDGTIGVTNDTTMQVTPNGVKFKFSY